MGLFAGPAMNSCNDSWLFCLAFSSITQTFWMRHRSYGSCTKQIPKRFTILPRNHLFQSAGLSHCSLEKLPVWGCCDYWKPSDNTTIGYDFFKQVAPRCSARLRRSPKQKPPRFRQGVPMARQRRMGISLQSITVRATICLQ